MDNRTYGFAGQSLEGTEYVFSSQRCSNQPLSASDIRNKLRWGAWEGRARYADYTTYTAPLYGNLFDDKKCPTAYDC